MNDEEPKTVTVAFWQREELRLNPYEKVLGCVRRSSLVLFPRAHRKGPQEVQVPGVQ